MFLLLAAIINTAQLVVYAPAGLSPAQIVRPGAVPDASTAVRLVPPSFCTVSRLDGAVTANCRQREVGVMAFLAGPEVAFVARGPTRVGAPEGDSILFLNHIIKKANRAASETVCIVNPHHSLAKFPPIFPPPISPLELYYHLPARQLQSSIYILYNNETDSYPI